MNQENTPLHESGVPMQEGKGLYDGWGCSTSNFHAGDWSTQFAVEFL